MVADFDPYDDGLFEPFVERKTRCKAVMLRYENVWAVAQHLVARRYETKISWGSNGLVLEAQREDQSFKANVENGDTLMLNGYDDVEYVPGTEFRRAWEREEK
jgi:hypothetical protein